MAEDFKPPMPLDATSSALATYLGGIVSLLVRRGALSQDDVRAVADMFPESEMARLDPVARGQHEAVRGMLFPVLKVKAQEG